MDESTDGDTPPGLRPGSRFGHYRLTRLLGRGGFGEVCEAEDTVMNRVVALKLLAAPYSQNRVFRHRLYREAAAVGRLNEPHVVPIHHCGEVDGQLYIDMRLIKGTDLQKVLARDGPLSPARAVAIVRQIASALDAAHADQIIHRDVKPANILLTGNDFACLVDFGIANAAADARLTSSGITIGTFAYMAPERFRTGEINYRADIYALACVLYECLTGSPPYTADSPALTLMSAHLTAPIPHPSQRRPEIPAGFDKVIESGMAKNPEDRYASAGELARAAHQALSAPDQDDVDTILANTQAATTDDRGQAQRPATKATSLLVQRFGPVAPIALTLLALIAVFIIVGASSIIVQHWLTQQPPAFPPPQQSAPSSWPSQVEPPFPPSQVELPFTGLRYPMGVAVDRTGTVYVTDFNNNRVLKLAPGATDQTVLPFTGALDPVQPEGVAVDTTGTVYVTDLNNNRVLKLAPGATDQTVLPFTGHANGVAADSEGNVYVTDVNNRVLKLRAGSNSQVELPFTGVTVPTGVAADSAGNVYVTDVNNRVLKLPAGSNTQVELPFTGLAHVEGGPSAGGLAVDTAGNVYLVDTPNNRVLKLPAGSNTQVELPFTDLKYPNGVAADTAGNVYVTDSGNNRVLKLPRG